MEMLGHCLTRCTFYPQYTYIYSSSISCSVYVVILCYSSRKYPSSHHSIKPIASRISAHPSLFHSVISPSRSILCTSISGCPNLVACRYQAKRIQTCRIL